MKFKNTPRATNNQIKFFTLIALLLFVAVRLWRRWRLQQAKEKAAASEEARGRAASAGQ
jgi:hypothetical protein